MPEAAEKPLYYILLMSLITYRTQFIQVWNMYNNKIIA